MYTNGNALVKRSYTVSYEQLSFEFEIHHDYTLTIDSGLGADSRKLVSHVS